MKKTIYATMIMALWAAQAQAQDRPVWSTDYAPQQQAQNIDQNDQPLSVGPPPAPISRTSKVFRQANYTRVRGGNADAAWQRQWGPIQNMTGIGSGQAKSFIAEVQERYKQGTAETLGNAKDWAVILASTGLVGTVTDSTTEWFKYATQDVPGALMNGDYYAGSTGLMGGSNGFGFYPGQ